MLIKMIDRDGTAEAMVHPTCVADHERLGWVVSTHEPEVEPEEQVEAPRRGRPPKVKE
jgi:hypothetical protein